MNIDQLLYVVSRTHDWSKSPNENIQRASELILHSEMMIEAKDRVEDMKARGLNPGEMFAEIMKERKERTHGGLGDFIDKLMKGAKNE